MRSYISLLLLLSSTNGFTQTLSAPLPQPEATPPTEQSETVVPVKKENVEKIEVTGSHIKRIDAEGVSPVTTLNRADIEKTGYNSVADVVRDTTVNSFGSTKEASGSNSAGNAEVDLRGLGSSNTLVLLNGQRLPSDAVTGAVDLNLIPMAAVERIEILKDGASAIYGSDALGGVVNIITRKDFAGSQISLTQSRPEQVGGRKQEISLVNGLNREGLNVVTVVQYRDNQAINSRDRSWSNNGVSKIGNPGSYRNASSTWHADANCPASQLIHSPAGDFCTFKYSDFSTELPALQQLSAMSETNYELNSKVKLVGRIGITQKKVQWSFAPAPGSFTIPGAVADHLGPGGTPLPGATPGQDLEVKYRLSELGTRDTQIVTRAYNVLLGTSIQVNNDWQVDITASQNQVNSKDTGVNGYALTKALTDAITSGNYNPFASAGAKGSLDSTKYAPEENTASQLSSVEAKASGVVGQMESGPLGIAVGATFTSQKYEDNFDDKSVNNEVFGNAGSSGGGSRETRAIFTEFSIPLTSKFEIQLAGRYDHYSDFGEAANPKAAFLYHATPSLLLRGSVGTGFKAPLMQDLYAATANGYPTFIDAVSCQREQLAGGATPSCTPQQYQVTSSGNKNLKEEKSISYSLGAIYEPSSDFNIGTDVFLTKLNNVVGIDYGDAMKAEARGVNLANYGVIVHRDASGYINSIEAPLQNLSSQEVSGFDLSAAYKIERVKLSTDHSQLFYFKEEGFPGAGATNKLGDYSRPAWRNTTAISYLLSEGQDLSLAALTTAGQENSVKDSGRLPNYTSYNLHYAYKTKTQGTFTLGIRNLLGSTPPMDDSNPNSPLNSSIYDQVGRQLIAGYKMNF